MRLLKLSEPPRSRKRVRDVAKDVGVPPGELLEALKELGEFVQSSASFLEEPVIRRVHAHFEVVYEEPDPSWRGSSPPPLPAATGLQPPAKRTRRNNHPLMTEKSRRRGDVVVRQVDPGWFDWRKRKRARPAEWTARSAEQQWADASSGDASAAFAFEEWKLLGFTEVERDVWLDAGLRSGQAKWADDLRDAGLSPTDLAVDLNGWKVIERLQQGEGAAAVARMLRASREAEAG